MNELIKTNRDNLKLYNEIDMIFLSQKAFAYYDNKFEMNKYLNVQRLPYCGGILFKKDTIIFKDINIFNDWREEKKNWEYTKHFFEDLLRKGTTDIEELLKELSPYITSGHKENIQTTYNKYLINIQKDPITLEDISTYGNLFLITLISVENKSLEHVLNLLKKYCIE